MLLQNAGEAGNTCDMKICGEHKYCIDEIGLILLSSFASLERAEQNISIKKSLRV